VNKAFCVSQSRSKVAQFKDKQKICETFKRPLYCRIYLYEKQNIPTSRDVCGMTVNNITAATKMTDFLCLRRLYVAIMSRCPDDTCQHALVRRAGESPACSRGVIMWPPVVICSFLRAMLCISAAYAVMRCPSVRLSVLLSVCHICGFCRIGWSHC